MTNMQKMMISLTIFIILFLIIILFGNEELISVSFIFLSFLFGFLWVFVGIQLSKPFDYSKYKDSYGTIVGINTDTGVSLNIEFIDENGNKHRGLSQKIFGNNGKYSEGDKVRIKYKLMEKPFLRNDAIVTVFDDELGEPRPNETNWPYIIFGCIWVFVTIMIVFKYINTMKI